MPGEWLRWCPMAGAHPVGPTHRAGFSLLHAEPTTPFLACSCPRPFSVCSIRPLQQLRSHLLPWLFQIRVLLWPPFHLPWFAAAGTLAHFVRADGYPDDPRHLRPPLLRL